MFGLEMPLVRGTRLSKGCQSGQRVFSLHCCMATVN